LIYSRVSVLSLCWHKYSLGRENQSFSLCWFSDYADLQVFRKSEFGISVEFTDLNHPIMVYLIPRNIGVLNRRNFAYLHKGNSPYVGLHTPKMGHPQKRGRSNFGGSFYGVGIA
jgi:hypothetical protein